MNHMFYNFFFLLLFALSCQDTNSTNLSVKEKSNQISINLPELDPIGNKISEKALSIVSNSIKYDPAYFSIPYPMGDVPSDRGVCTDVVIRTYRKLGIDLQKEVHEDIKNNFKLYPKTWGLSKPDTNIDHRRVPNLMVFFSRKGKSKEISKNAEDYLPGDIVTWTLKNRMTHIGVIVNKKSDDGKRYLVVHNIGNGQEISDCLFSFTITGHYSYQPEKIQL